MCRGDWACADQIYAANYCYNHYRRELRREESNWYAEERDRINRLWAFTVEHLGLSGAKDRKVGI